MTVAIPETDLRRINRILLEKHAELSQQLNKRPDDEDVSSNIPDENMRGTQREKEMRTTVGLNWVRDRLREVEEELRRIKDGTYGICEECENEISLKRLEAYPNTTLCVECKGKKEKGQRK